MAERDDGGPAWPTLGFTDDKDGKGMSLRDWFAGQALMRLVADYGYAQAAEESYEYADAMIAAKREREGRR